ncbi:TIGR00730 family Rossman fold protein [bacterium]|nr:TIGR00730 family Rossman fold protein [bacterium]
MSGHLIKPVAVCVFCSSSSFLNPLILSAGKELGEGLARLGLELIYGGGNSGLMGVVAIAHQAEGGKVVGVILDSMAHDYRHPDPPQKVITTSNPGERKKRMSDLSGAFLVLPGGFGTYSELFEMLSSKQLGILDKPIIILNTNGYFEPLLAMLFHSVTEKTIKTEHLRLFDVVNTVSEALEKLKTPKEK